jgi:hypothetical protein
MSETISKKEKRVLPLQKPKKVVGIKIAWAFFILIGLLLAALSYTESVVFDEEGNVKGLSKKQTEKFLADSAKKERCVQYALVADTSDFYTNCKGELVYLLEGEIWKYGVTCEKISEKRYSKGYLTKNKLYFLIQFKGNRFECEYEEKKKLFYYPLLPENVRRRSKERLVLPPGNCQTR